MPVWKMIILHITICCDYVTKQNGGNLCVKKNFKTSVQDYHKSEISVDFQLEIDFSE